MNKTIVRQSFPVAVAAFLSLTYALLVRDLRTEHKNAALGILISISQPLMTGLVFYVFMNLLGGSAAPIRGDDLTFTLIGFILFFMHIRTANAVGGAIRRDMMNHQRLTPFLMVCVKAMASFYKNVLALLVMIALNYLLRGIYVMQDPLTFVLVVFWCWMGGVAAGLIFMALNRYFTWGPIVQSTFTRVMFFTSGKFFVASKLPAHFRPFMDWNPLFHLLDQGRGAVFLNYGARTTDMSYAIWVILAVLVIGFLVEHQVRVNYSASHSPS